MDAFPAFYSLKDRKVVIAGAGEGAEANARLFEGAPCELVCVEGDDAHTPETYRDAILAFVGHADEIWCAKAAEAARRAGVPVNVVDRPRLSDFSTPAVIDRGEVVAAVGTGGAAPMLASMLRGEIESKVPEGAGRVAALLSQMKDEVRQALPDLARRRAFLRDIINGPVASAAMEGDANGARNLMRQALAQAGGERVGVIWLLDGRGPVDLLSLRALRALGEVDSAVMADGVDVGIKSRLRRDAHRLKEMTAGQIIARASKGEKIAVISATAPAAVMIETAAKAGVTAEILPVARA